MASRSVLSLLLVLPALVPLAAAQASASDLNLILDTQDFEVPAAGNLVLPIAWTYSPAVPAEATLTLTLECTSGNATAEPVVQTIDAQPAPIQGRAELRVVATAGAGALDPLPCDIVGTIDGPLDVHDANDRVQAIFTVAFSGDIVVEARDDARMAGPQKLIPYPILVTNQANAAVHVVFSLPDPPGGRWNLVLPEGVVVPAGEEVLVIATVATPFYNGYNSDRQEFQLLAHATAVADESLALEPRPVAFTSKVEGFYVPGPNPVLLLLGLVAIALLIRARTA